MANTVASSIEPDTQERRFFFAFASFLLLIVVVGFAPSLVRDGAFVRNLA